MDHPTKEIKKIAKRIIEVRGKLSRKAFGVLISESGSNIQKYEEGQVASKNEPPRQHTIPSDVLIKISKAYKINICWLIEGRPHKKYKK